MDLDFTPTSAANLVHLESRLHIGAALATWLVFFVIEDAIADAIVASLHYLTTDGGSAALVLDHQRRAASTTQRTYNLRAGGSTSTTFGINAIGVDAGLGGRLTSFLQATEIMA
jgi:hypothetical protein